MNRGRRGTCRPLALIGVYAGKRASPGCPHCNWLGCHRFYSATKSTPVISNRAPPSDPSVTRTLHPWASAISSTMLNPKPLPVADVENPGSNTCSRSSSGMPAPSSSMKNPLSSMTPIVTVMSSFPWSMVFRKRFCQRSRARLRARVHHERVKLLLEL